VRGEGQKEKEGRKKIKEEILKKKSEKEGEEERMREEKERILEKVCKGDSIGVLLISKETNIQQEGEPANFFNPNSLGGENIQGNSSWNNQ
jgi:hypothetical protein